VTELLTLLFATRNPGKIVELRELLSDLPLRVRALGDGLECPEVEEDADSFTGNAIKKAKEVSTATGLAALADDSGLLVDALGGRPGVFSARFAGPNANDSDNNRKLLAELAGVADPERGARFRSVVAFADCAGALGQDVLTASGECEGLILSDPRGNGGFGYDPLFYVPELGQTFAELGVGTKNERSHRARAMRAMRPLLLQYYGLANGGLTQ